MVSHCYFNLQFPNNIILIIFSYACLPLIYLPPIYLLIFFGEVSLKLGSLVFYYRILIVVRVFWVSVLYKIYVL